MIKRNATADEIRQVMKARAAKPVLNCPVCNNEYVQNRSWQKFCSSKCRNDWHEFVRNGRVENDA